MCVVYACVCVCVYVACVVCVCVFVCVRVCVCVCVVYACVCVACVCVCVCVKQAAEAKYSLQMMAEMGNHISRKGCGIHGVPKIADIEDTVWIATDHAAIFIDIPTTSHSV